MTAVRRGYLKNGLHALKGARLRSFWTMLGIIIGVMSVIVIVSVGIGIKQQISGQIHKLGKNVVLIRPAQLRNGRLSTLTGGISSQLTARDVGLVDKVPGVTAVAPLSAVLGTPHGQHGDYTDGLVIATTPELPGLLNQSMAYGIFLSADDHGQMAAVLGQQAAQALFDDSVPLGRSFTFRGREFIVRGIFNDFNNTPLSEQADFNKAIFIPYDVGQVLTNASAPTYEILAKTSGQHTAEVAASITEALKKNHGGQADFTVLQQNQNIAQSDDIVGLLTVMISVVAGISLLVGGIGIMNVMLVTVTERMREIGIRKAVGATNRQILGQFLVEATLLSFTGGIIGIALACLVDLGLGVFTDLRPVIQWQVVALAAGVSLLIGIVFGSLPALKAARKDPIAALRAE